MTIKMMKTLMVSAWFDTTAVKVDIIFVGVLFAAATSLMFDSGIMYVFGIPLCFVFLFLRNLLLGYLALFRLNLGIHRTLDRLRGFNGILPYSVGLSTHQVLMPLNDDELFVYIPEKGEHAITDFIDAKSRWKSTVIRLMVNSPHPLPSMSVGPVEGMWGWVSALEHMLTPDALTPANNPTRAVNFTFPSDADVDTIPRISVRVLELRLEQFAKEIIELDPYVPLAMALEELA